MTHMGDRTERTAEHEQIQVKHIATGLYAFIQDDGSWGWSNAGLVADQGEELLVDTFFTLPQALRLKSSIEAADPDVRVATIIDTHLNGDHCHGNQLFPDAEALPHTAPRRKPRTRCRRRRTSTFSRILRQESLGNTSFGTPVTSASPASSSQPLSGTSANGWT